MASSSSPSFDQIRSQIPFITQIHHTKNSRRAKDDHIYLALSKKSKEEAFLDLQIPADDVSNLEVQGRKTLLQSTPKVSNRSQLNSTQSLHTREASTPDPSIECRPLELHSAQTGTQRLSQLAGTDEASSTLPFPLMEWIQLMRKEGHSTRPTSKLRWSRTISKRQKTILENDDAWFPSLPGRPSRQGTIPIDILTNLLYQADEEAEAKASDKAKISLQDNIRTLAPRGSQTQPQTVRSHLLSITSEHSDEEEAELPWSSSPPSPPRQQLPPDTSPNRPSLHETPCLMPKKHMNAFPDDDSQDTNHGDRDLVAETRLADSTISDQPGISSTSAQALVPEQEVDVSSERTEESEDERIEKVDSADVGLPEASYIDAIAQKIDILRTAKKSRHQVLIKETPHPSKGILRPSPSPIPNESDEAPQSSLVAATYPESILHDRTEQRRANQTQSRKPPSVTSHTTRSSPERERKSLENQGLHWIPQPTPRQVISQPNSQVSDVVARKLSTLKPKSILSDCHSQVEYGRRSSRHPSRERSQQNEQSNSPSSHDTAEKLHAFRQRRKQESREFRQRLQKNTNTADHGKQSTQSQASTLARPKITSEVTSPNRINDPASWTGFDDASAVNLSVNRSARSKTSTNRTSASKTPPQNTLPNTDTGELDLFRRFCLAYPTYKGKSGTFQKAVGMLATFDLHPSLFDDFVFRMAGEYKKFLMECVEGDRDALPYKDYYYTHVTRAECTDNIVTAQALKVHTSSSSSAAAARKPTITSAIDDRKGTDLANDTLSCALSRSSSAFPPPQISPSTRYMAKSVQWETSANNVDQRPKKELHSNQIIPESSSLKEEAFNHVVQAKKRRSLPWGYHSPPIAKYSGTIQKLKLPVTIGTSEDLTSSVEHWLNRPAGASSPEIEPAPIQTPKSRSLAAPKTEPKTDHVLTSHTSNNAESMESVIAARSQVIIPNNAHIPIDKTPTPPVSIVVSEVTSLVEPVVTPFTLFTRDYANLQSEKWYHGTVAKKRKLPVNMYNW